MSSVASVHRFRDKVAVYLGTGETTYLTQEQALDLAVAMCDCSQDIETHPKFSESEFTTTEVPE